MKYITATLIRGQIIMAPHISIHTNSIVNHNGNHKSVYLISNHNGAGVSEDKSRWSPKKVQAYHEKFNN